MGPIWGRQDPGGPHVGPMNYLGANIKKISCWYGMRCNRDIGLAKMISCTIICCRFHIYPRYISQESWVLFLYYGAVLWYAQIIEYILARWWYSPVGTSHYIIIIIMKTYQNVLNLKTVCQVHSVECASKIEPVLSTIFHAIYGDMCIQLTNLSYEDFEDTRTYLIIIIKSEVWPICQNFWL